jgi:predicted transcriptional regulator
VIITHFDEFYPHLKYPISPKRVTESAIDKLINIYKNFNDKELENLIDIYLIEREKVNFRLDSEKYKI